MARFCLHKPSPSHHDAEASGRVTGEPEAPARRRLPRAEGPWRQKARPTAAERPARARRACARCACARRPRRPFGSALRRRGLNGLLVHNPRRVVGGSSPPRAPVTRPPWARNPPPGPAQEERAGPLRAAATPPASVSFPGGGIFYRRTICSREWPNLGLTPAGE